MRSRSRRAAASRPPTVVLACPGLDHALRGFETFARECFEALRHRSDLDIELVKGTGAAGPGERVVPTLTRDTRLARGLARQRHMEPFVVEHVAFALAFIPLLLRQRPEIVYFSEWHVGRVLAAWRRATRQSFSLVFSNGAGVPSGYGHLDHIQQLVPGAIEYTVGQGESADRQELLPYGVAIDPSAPLLGDADRKSLRNRLGLPSDRRIVLSVGAINRPKRMDYMIEEVASMRAPRPYLLILGQEEADTPEIRRLALERLGADGHEIRTVDQETMAEHYRASDVFVLASLWETFGRVLVEAQSHGLPCLAHDYPVMSWVLGSEGETADLREPGAVAAWLNGVSSAELTEESRRRRHRYAYERFSWESLADPYAQMLRTVAEGRRTSATSLEGRAS